MIMNTGNERERNGNGDFATTINSTHLDAQAAQLHAQGKRYRDIAAQLGISLGSAHQRVQRAKEKAIVPAATEAVQQIIDNLAAERANLEEIRDNLIAEFHDGYTVESDDGPTVVDPELRLKTAEQVRRITDQLMKVDDQVARLLGLNQPAKAQVSGEVTYHIVGLDGPE